MNHFWNMDQDFKNNAKQFTFKDITKKLIIRDDKRLWAGRLKFFWRFDAQNEAYSYWEQKGENKKSDNSSPHHFTHKRSTVIIKVKEHFIFIGLFRRLKLEWSQGNTIFRRIGNGHVSAGQTSPFWKIKIIFCSLLLRLK